MLKSLHIENYAIIEQLDIEFAPSLNIITGETGAGKSILLGALSLLGGARADASAISDGADSCVVEGTFSIEGYGLEGLFEEQELDFDPIVDIRRVISRSGKSRSFVGACPVSLQTLRAIADRLIDIHSQHQTLLLSRGDFQRQIVDAVAENASLVEKYRAVYERLLAIAREIDILRKAQADGAKMSDYLSFQIEELQTAAVRQGEQEELEAEQKQLSHAEEITSTLAGVVSALDGEDQSVLSAVRQGAQALSRITANYAAAEELAERLNSCYIELKDIASEVEDAASEVELDPRRLEKVDERLDLIYTLCKKHSLESGDELPALLAKFSMQYEAIENGDQMIAQKEEEAAKAEIEARQLADKISETRRKTSPKIEKHIVESLLKLGIKHPQFAIEVAQTELNAYGADEVHFLFSANEKSAPQPIEGVASGGEMSRLMLSIKELVAKKLKMPTVIFDEIDTGVSGAVADAMGTIIENMGTQMQVINITHLPQVAAKGDHHYKVYKDSATHIVKLEDKERVAEIAAMLSGAAITDAARAQAKTLLKK